MEFEKELLKGYIDIILISIVKEKPMYGYEIAKKVRDISGGAFDLKEATLYMALKRLEKQGVVEAFWGGEQEASGGGRRKYYRLLTAGEERLHGSRQGWTIFRNFMDSLMGRE